MDWLTTGQRSSYNEQFYHWGVETSAMFNQVGSTMNGAHAPPSEDRYAALKDLDSLMKQTQLKEETAGMQSTWNANNTNGEYITFTAR